MEKNAYMNIYNFSSLQSTEETETFDISDLLKSTVIEKYEKKRNYNRYNR